MLVGHTFTSNASLCCSKFVNVGCVILIASLLVMLPLVSMLPPEYMY